MTARRVRLALVAVVSTAGGCGSSAPGSADAPPVTDAPATVDAGAGAGTDAAPRPFTPQAFDGNYYAHDVLLNRCDHLLKIAGSEPAEAGRFPLAIFLVGTNGDYAGPGIIDYVLPAFAAQGFVAASLEYENSTLFGAAQNCGLYQDNASCMIRNDADYVGGEHRSAIAQLCSRAKADCSKGVVFIGHSQGGLTAVQAFHFTPVAPPAGEPVPRLVAAAPMGVGPAGYVLGIRVIDVHTCMTAATLPLDPSHLLAVNGENDRYFNGPDADQAGGQLALEAVTGRSCAAPSWDCRGAGGDGYVLVKPGDLVDGVAPHDYMHDHDANPATPFEEPDWISPDNPAPWGLYSTARWLKAQTAP